MTWMLTYSGHCVSLAHAEPITIDMACIAHSLANTNRFVGHARRPYSVAEHSLLVCEILEREAGVRDPHVLMAGLLHDAHEAYCGDMSAPMKDLLRDACARLNIPSVWDAAERRLQANVLAFFGAADAMARHARLIHTADMIALSCERRDMLPASGPAWPVTIEHPPLSWVNLFAHDGMGWQDWERAFRDRFDELGYAIELQPPPIWRDVTAMPVAGVTHWADMPAGPTAC